MFVVHGVSHDPNDHDRVIGWAVFRPAPWHLAGVFATEHMAMEELQAVGDGYQVQFGSYKLGSQDFKASTFEL